MAKVQTCRERVRGSGTATIALLILLTACKVYDPLYCDEDRPCDDPARPFCDIAGEYPASEGIKKTCIADPFADPDGDPGDPDAGPPIACATPGEPVRCDDDSLVSCGDTSLEERAPCPLGCNTDELRCWDLDPSNDLAAFLDQAADAPPLELTGVAVFDTDTGNLRNGDDTAVFAQTALVEASPNGVPIRVVVAATVDIESIAVSGIAALAIVADGDVVIRGRLSVAADYNVPGPGSLQGGSLPCFGELGLTTEVSAHFQIAAHGGGGGKTAGGRGGSVEDSAGGGSGGDRYDNLALEPLRGGCRGSNSLNGGGAAQIVSGGRIQVLEGAVVNANGGGGAEPGFGPSGKVGDAGGGGGAGGGILLEAPEVTIEGGIFANGGGGTAQCGMEAEGGRESLEPALGAQCPDTGDGGGGGSALDGPTDGETVPLSVSTDSYAGSGGGSAGFVRINTGSGTFLPAASALISPTAGVGTLTTR